jgi:hypothetical protein
MKQPLKFKLKICDGKDIEYITYLGEEHVGIVHGSPAKLTVVNIESGSILWEQEYVETYGGVAVPIYDKKAVYIPLERDNSRSLLANDPLTGKKLWNCLLSNNKYQFMVPLAQTENYAAVYNTNTRTLSIIDKTNGRIKSNVKTAHPMPDYSPYLLTWSNKFIAIALDKSKNKFVFDLYDPDTEAIFVKTLGIFPEKWSVERIGESQVIIVGDYLCFYGGQGRLSKFNLAKSEMEAQNYPLDSAEGDYHFNKHITVNENMLICVLEHVTGIDELSEIFVCKYDLNTNTFAAVYPLELKMDESHIHHGNILPIYEGFGIHMSKNGIVKYALSGNSAISTEIELDDWADHFDDDFLHGHTGKQGEEWIIANSKLLVIRKAPVFNYNTPLNEDKDETPLEREDAGYLFCWEINN